MPTDLLPNERVELTEDRVPVEGIEDNIAELVELYGGKITGWGSSERTFELPLRRGVAAGGGVECQLSWVADAQTLRMTCDRSVDAPKAQRVALLSAGVVGALLFTMWPFFGKGSQLGAVAWMGGAVALAVFFLTMRKTSGGLAYDFLRRLADRQRAAAAPKAAD
jgi:hypothetical protein